MEGRLLPSGRWKAGVPWAECGVGRVGMARAGPAAVALRLGLTPSGEGGCG